MTGKFRKFVCCFLDLTISVRIISTFCLILATILFTVLLNDSCSYNFVATKRIAIASGLDWHYILSFDEEIISTILLTYTFVFLIVSSLLLFASITQKRAFTFPWLVIQFFACLLKISSIIRNLASKRQDDHFIIGSCIHVGILVWWWCIVWGTLDVWKLKKINLERSSYPESPVLGVTFKVPVHETPKRHNETLLLESPAPHQPNPNYCMI